MTNQKSKLPDWMLRILPKLDIQTRVKFNRLGQQKQDEIVSSLLNMRTQMLGQGKSAFEAERTLLETLSKQLSSIQ